MFEKYSDIGTCLSKVISDYGVDLKPSYCLLLSSPIWLGLDTRTDNKSYSPLIPNAVYYFHPNFLEFFSVNANCLFVPLRSGSTDDIEYLLKRVGNKKKALVKVAEDILSTINGNSLYQSITIPAVVEGLDYSDESKPPLMQLFFSTNTTITTSQDSFLHYWYDESNGKANADWYLMIPSQTKQSEELLVRKIKAAITRQYYNLKLTNSAFLNGPNMLMYLADSLRNGTGYYGQIAAHNQLWYKKYPLVSLRRDYATALAEEAIIQIPGVPELHSSLLENVQEWQTFFMTFMHSNNEYDSSFFIDNYKKLAIQENMIINKFEKII